MKIRDGFVSNSSSSSFICVGVAIERKTIEKAIGKDYYDYYENELGDHEMVYWDSEGTDLVFYGDYELKDTYDGIEMTNVLSKRSKFDDLEKRFKKDAAELFKVSEKDMEFGVFIGTVAT